MDETIFGNRKYAYALYSLSAALLFGAAILYAKLIIPAIILLALSVIYFHSGQLINTAILQKKKVIVVSGGYSLGRNTTSIVRRIGGLYESVSIAIFYMNHTPRSEADLFEALLDKVDTPFEFSMCLEPFDKKKVVDSLRTRRSMKELAFSNLGKAEYAKSNRLKRELAFIDEEIAQLNGGSKPFMTLFKLKCTAVADAESEASREAASRIERTAQAFASTFDASYTILKGGDLLRNL